MATVLSGHVVLRWVECHRWPRSTGEQNGPRPAAYPEAVNDAATAGCPWGGTSTAPARLPEPKGPASRLLEEIVFVQPPAARHLLVGFVQSRDLRREGWKVFVPLLFLEQARVVLHGFQAAPEPSLSSQTQYLRTKGIKPQFPNGIVSSVSLVSTTNTARSLAGCVSLALALTAWRSPGSSEKLCPAW
jgi:hypothetical protein